MEQNHYRHAEEILTKVAASVQRQEDVDLTELTHLADSIVESLQGSDQLVVEALSSPSGPPLVTNLINVGILATKVGIGLGYYGVELHRLAVAGLLHDIGIFAVPQQLLTKAGRLTAEERTLVEQHPRLGSEVIRRVGTEYGWLAEVVLQAHERGKGQGYPHRLKGREINELAQIIGLVDIFDALVSPRPYRRRLLPHEAVRELLTTERTAFPREIMKALVEQLSVYPLGTRVRLSSGQEGVVVRITARYPSRPVLRITSTETAAPSEPPHLLDLSLLPHVSVVDTVEPPALDRVTFEAAGAAPAASAAPTNVSDQFAALLESLDAIAGVIQAAVDQPAVARGPAQVPAEAETAEPLIPVRREILGLFVLEAREWLNQIQTALERLDATSEQARRAQLASILWQSVNNLARSAATVGLTAVETMATRLFPLLQAAARHERAVAAHHVASLREGLLEISKTVQELRPIEEHPAPAEETVEREQPILEQPARTELPESQASSEPASEIATPRYAPPRPMPASSILDALRQLHVARGRSLEPVRDVLETVIQRAERELAQGAPVVDARAIGRLLQELDELDERFLNHMQARVPSVVSTLGRIARASEERVLPPQALEPIFEEIDVLFEASEKVSAENISVFLQGLRTFLRVTAQHKPAVIRERLAAVEERLATLIPLAQQWVDVGRVERAAIFDILPMA
ncbi:MAG: HD domain-containing protein [Nitrospira sp.]|nr:HD domain-containing protein [Nitrospira sp.]MCW5796099.1 HD domain-containing protein [Nitrospira sp.]HNA48169.1 HD domain-containing phosphohydrolase [Nitrospira sp.]HNA83950.1 HD domain-containing phosphohydrolase [Nitrospira sp.]HND01633.1 HD domain-containing phosphohydrolase [Nitrospira sp.]